MTLPEELAPALRARAEALLAAVPVATRPRDDRPEDRRGTCWHCGKRGGRLVMHHRVHGDDSTVVRVHPSCHRKLHPKPRTEVRTTA